MAQPFTEHWTRFTGTLEQCLNKAWDLYHYRTHEDQGGHDWRVLVRAATDGKHITAIGRQDRDTHTPQELYEDVKQRPAEASRPAVLEYDAGWFGESLDIGEQHYWTFGKLYFDDGSKDPIALFYRIDFPDEDEEESESNQ
jgi:hypothetical protein